MSPLQNWFRSFIASLFGTKSAKSASPIKSSAAAKPRIERRQALQRPTLKSTGDSEPGQAAPSSQGQDAEHPEPGMATPGDAAPPKPRLNFDSTKILRTPMGQRDAELVERIGKSIERGKFQLPQLPATSTALMGLSGKADVEVDEVVSLISSDPSLASELLRLANSAVYATEVPAETLNEALMRIGLRGLRSLVFSVSVRGSVLRTKSLQIYSEEIWRQAFSVASIARQLAPACRMDRDRAFLVGLLHDVGKIALLSMISREMRKDETLSPATAGRVFYVHHERAGRALATKWRLDPEIVSVAGNHHDFMANEEYSRSAALASLAHKIDLSLTGNDERGFQELHDSPEFEHLQIPEEMRLDLLDEARRSRLPETEEEDPLVEEQVA